ncbi:MAG: serine/threonine-protein phosphatase [Acidobacteriota bacterium]|nr:serine/threonine-protein phosphatase [Acidobacteriota bacterium]
MQRAALASLVLLCAVPSSAQTLRAKQPPAPAPLAQAASPALPVKLGESSAELTGPWKFRIGDDASWARPELDDSAWATMDLTIPKGSAGAGWTARGYPGYSGFAWYRLRIDVNGANHRLALKMPDQADDAYQVFVNGQEIGEFGRFSGGRVTAYPSLPEAFPFPRGVGNGTVTIAVRMWMDSATRFNSPDAGGLHGPPTLGYASLINALVRLDYNDLAHYLGSGFLEMMIVFMALLMAGALFWLDPDERAYLWLEMVCSVTLLGGIVVLSVNFTAWLGQTTAVVLNDVVLTPTRIGLWVLFWGYWFRLARMRWLHMVVWPLAAMLALGTATLRPPIYGQLVPVHASAVIAPTLLGIKLALGVLLFLVAFRGFRTQKTEGWMAASAILLAFVGNYQHEMRLAHIRTTFSIAGFTVSLGTMATVTSLLIITVMLLRRFIQAQARKEQWKLEIEQAQQVQQLLIPHELPEIAGLRIDSDYRPAREVGGDFFQILPLSPPGTALIVVGDVTGKGVQAGMLVALIIGAIRAAVQHRLDPLQILGEVNDQLCERGQAIATCLILRIDPDGSVTIANAGQLPPYLNGTEYAMDGAFPIGMVPEAEFAVARFTLAPGDSLFLMSDGVVEAQDPEGTLFGFDRVGEMLRERTSSATIASAAQDFGQEDDILVLQIHRTGAPATAPLADALLSRLPELPYAEA